MGYANGSKDTLLGKNQTDDHHHVNGTYEPLAVIGLSLKFPQDATTPDAFFQMLLDKRCVMSEWPSDRLNIDAFYKPSDISVDTIPVRGGHFLKEPIGRFDAPFFMLTSSEAVAMDPQQRLLLETAYRALENAGISLEQASGSNTSVYTGCFSDDYRINIAKDPLTLPMYAATGVAPSMLAARLSWFFNFTGPCVNLDSACSSSMMAFDLACQGLRNRETDMALVGGANIMGLDMSLILSNMNFLSHDSRSFSFDHRANGYGRGEGFGAVIIKRLSDALRDGDTIRAVVRSSGSNQDGHTPGITQPSGEAQLRLIKETYKKAGLEMGPTGYVEAHGTGTAIGDPVEAGAIGAAFRDSRSTVNPLFMRRSYRGTVKSNIGHLEGASGIAGIIKAILILESALIPANANFEQLNPKIDADSLQIAFPKSSTPWPNKGLRRVSVMSFGNGGSNSQAVLDDACNFLRFSNLAGNHWSVQDPPALTNADKCLPWQRLPSLLQTAFGSRPYGDTMKPLPKLLVWSAADDDGLKRIGSAYRAHMTNILPSLDAQEASAYLESLAYTLASRRTALKWKAFLVARSLPDLAAQAWQISKAHHIVDRPKLGYVFTGQGAQYAGMAEGLLCYPAFRTSLQSSETYLAEFGCNWSLIAEILKPLETSNIDKPAYSQPLCTALQIGFVDLLSSFGLIPSAVVGHSSGEIAAAYCIGALSHQAACKVAFFRGQCASKLDVSTTHRGAMLAVGLSEEAIKPYIEKASHLVVACVNSPSNVTVSGDIAEIDALITLLDGHSVFCRKLRVNIAYHSPHMSEVAADYLELLGSLENGGAVDKESDTAMISTVTSQAIARNRLQQSEYWVQNLVSQVKFSAAISHLCLAAGKDPGKKLGAARATTRITDLLELGPAASLGGPIKEILNAGNNTYSSYNSVMKRKSPATETLLDAVGHLYCAGYVVDVSKANILGARRNNLPVVLPDLPEYPFDHSREYWHESRSNIEGYRLRKNGSLDLLGTPMVDSNSLDARWRGFLRISSAPWIEDHKVNDTIVYPAAGMLVMAIEAAKQMVDDDKQIKAFVITDTTFSSPLTVTGDTQGTETQVQLQPLADPLSKVLSSYSFRVSMRSPDNWIQTCCGTIQVEYEKPETQVDKGREASELMHGYRRVLDEAMQNSNRKVDRRKMYEYMHSIGLKYGPTFQALRDIYCDDNGTASAYVDTLDTIAPELAATAQVHVIHPTTLDCLFQLMMVALSGGGKTVIPTVMLTRIGRLWISGHSTRDSSTCIINAHAEAIFTGRRKTSGSLFALNAVNNSVLMSLESTEVTTVSISGEHLQNQIEKRKLCYKLAWKPDPDELTTRQASDYCEENRPQRASAAELYTKLGFLMIKALFEVLEALPNDHPWGAGSHLSRYYSWAKYQVERFQAGQLPFLSNKHPLWQTLTRNPQCADKLIAESKTTIQGKFYMNVAEHLLPILKGEIDPLEFMFEDESIPEFYREVNEKVICYEPLQRYLDIVSHKNPALKILEVGAGTGSTTDFILNALNVYHEGGGNTLGCTRYDYTDISPAFFEAATARFARQQEQLRYKILDITKDPVAQGFQLGDYDLIIAASVLHATKNLEVTMRNTRALLKPGGKLIVFEVTEDVIRARFAFGLLPGWWLSEEDYRRSGPCISINEWDKLMRSTGFSGTDISIPDFVEESCHEYTIMISTAISEVDKETPSSITHRTLPTIACVVLDESSALQQEIANKLRNSLRATPSLDCHVVPLHHIGEVDNLDKTPCIFLIELESALLANLGKEGLAALQRIVKECPQILWATHGGGRLQHHPWFHLIDGFSRVTRTEFPDLTFTTLAFDGSLLSRAGHAIDQYVECIVRILLHQLSHSAVELEPEYQQRNGRLEISRLVETTDLDNAINIKVLPYQRKMQILSEVPPVALQVESPGLLESLRFVECPPSPTLKSGQLEIEIRATGVNFIDCLTALGEVDSANIGGECAGIVSKVGPQCKYAPGDHVIALTRNAYRSFTHTSSEQVVGLPKGMSFAEGSALPIIFATAWIALQDTARLLPGESVLIHAGAGGTGQAAIQVARVLGADVFVTVGSDEKKHLLMSLYGIQEDHILYSRDTSFAQGIMRMTGEKGVDVVLNSLSGEGLRASWTCLAPLGRFIEIGKRDIHSHAHLPMWHFHKNVTFSSVDLSVVTEKNPSAINTALSRIMTLFTAKKLHIPQPFQAYGISELQDVLRRLQSGNAAGKMAIEMRGSDSVPTVLRTKSDCKFGSDKSYLIAGGFGGLGRSTARWLAQRGAKYLVLLSRSGPISTTSVSLVKELETMGVYVHAPACDITDFSALSSTISSCAKNMPPVRGVIQASMVLQDAIWEHQTLFSWQTCIAPKVQGTYNLHSLFPDLDFFIALASIAGIIGSGGQANYAAGNTYMDALCRYRVASGQKSASLDLGWMAQEGVVAESSTLTTSMADAAHVLPIYQTEFHALLDYYCNPAIQIDESNVQVVLGPETPAAMRRKGLKEPLWMQRPTFAHLRQIGHGQQGHSENSEGTTNYAELLSAAGSIDEAAQIVIKGLTERLAKALRVPAETIDTKKPLHQYGVDSLLAVELRNWFAKTCAAQIAVFNIVGAASFEELGERIVKKSRFCDELLKRSGG